MAELDARELFGADTQDDLDDGVMAALEEMVDEHDETASCGAIPDPDGVPAELADPEVCMECNVGAAPTEPDVSASGAVPAFEDAIGNPDSFDARDDALFAALDAEIAAGPSTQLDTQDDSLRTSYGRSHSFEAAPSPGASSPQRHARSSVDAAASSPPRLEPAATSAPPVPAAAPMPMSPPASKSFSDAPPPAAETGSSSLDLGADGGDGFTDESRFMTDAAGNRLHKWCIGYAARGGGGRAMCRDLECLERLGQDGVRVIEKGQLRIGRRVLLDKEGDGQVTFMWYHARCIFNTFTRSRKTTRVIESLEDLEGIEAVQLDDQAMLKRILDGQEDLRTAQFRSGDGPGPTPRKRPGVDKENTPFDSKKDEPAWKKRKGSDRELKKGDRVWTHCRVRPKPVPGQAPAAGGMEFAVKSAKPELGMVFEEPKDGNVIVQFESAEHEKERLDMYQNRRYYGIRGWLRYPRLFEGKKQRLPLTFIQWNRTPPRMCTCNKQEWGHWCDCTGIACGRGDSTKVYGVGMGAY